MSTMVITTEAGADLQELVVALTGCDPLVEVAFQWSESLPCEVCDAKAATATVSLGGEDEQRLCHGCLAEVVV